MIKSGGFCFHRNGCDLLTLPPEIERLTYVRVISIALGIFLCLVTNACRSWSDTGPLAGQKTSPLTAEEELQTVTLAEGFEIELVAADPDMLKVVDIAFDDSGRMWAVTASEYPRDANDEIEAIARKEQSSLSGSPSGPNMDASSRIAPTFSKTRELYKKGGRDQVLVFDTPTASGRQKPRVYAEGMFIPLSVLPLREGALVCQGPDILLLEDHDGDGKADERSLLLTGFGIGDSHSNAHRLTRGPGGWIYVMQGGATFSQVRRPGGDPVEVNFAKVARFRRDGTQFEKFAHGHNNTWGLVIDRLGGMWIQEANDRGYPVVPVTLGASYPGLGRGRTKPYTPWHPPLADFKVGGTGLSGLALSEDMGFPESFRDSILLANPITRTINSVNVHRDGDDVRLEQGPNLVESSDPWFRPVAVHFGPDGALYIVDWYNKIISHNEVLRTHPERDKVSSRIWRVRRRDMSRPKIPDLTEIPENQLLDYLKADITWEARAAWHQIVDRKAVSLVPELTRMVLDGQTPTHQRLLALWSLEELGTAEARVLESLISSPHPALRREAVLVLGTLDLGTQVTGLLEPLQRDPAWEVRLEMIRTIGKILSPGPEDIEFLLRMVQPPQETEWTSVVGVETLDPFSYRRAFERSLLRAALEEHPEALGAFLKSPEGRSLPLENRLLAGLVLGGRDDALLVVRAVPQLERAPALQELLLAVNHLEDPSVRKGVQLLLLDSVKALPILDILDRFSQEVPISVSQSGTWGSLISGSLRDLLAKSPGPASEDLLVNLVSTYRLRSLEPEVAALLDRNDLSEDRQLAALQALLQIQSQDVVLFQRFLQDRQAGRKLRRTALEALASSDSVRATSLLLQIWDGLSESEQKLALTSLTRTPSGGLSLLAAIKARKISPVLIDSFFLNHLKVLLGPNDPDLRHLESQVAQFTEKVLQLPGGKPVSFCDTNIDLEGPFTVETWLKLDEPIDGGDGILGDDVSGTFNFHEGRLRVTLGSGGEDLVVANTPAPSGQWFHAAVTRDQDGLFRIYLNGALDADQSKAWQAPLEALDIGRTQSLIYSAYNGTSGLLTEFRVWDVARSDEEIWQTYQSSFRNSPRDPHLTHYYEGDSWGPLARDARIVSTPDYPHLFSEEEAAARAARFTEVQDLASRPGDALRGRKISKELCVVCHRVGAEGKDVGPALDGTAATGLDAMIRAILTPNAGIEAGYRTMRVVTKEGEIIEGCLLEENEDAITVTQQGTEPLRIPQKNVRSAQFLNTSVMPEGLLDDLTPAEITDLFGYLKTLK